MTDALPADSVINDYRIDGVLSDLGNFSIVYRATDLNAERVEQRRAKIAGRLGRWAKRYGAWAAEARIDAGPAVAIKEFWPRDRVRRDRSGRLAVADRDQRAVVDWARQRFINERRFLGNHSHPNIVAMFDMMTAYNTEYYVMEMLTGGSLESLIARSGAQDERQIMAWLPAVLAGLDSVEAAGTNHLDLSPRNILFRAPGSEAVIVDFGAARIAAAQPLGSMQFMVDAHYAAPEKRLFNVSSGKLGAHTDIYSVGAIVNFALSGEPPLGCELRTPDGNESGLSHAAHHARASRASAAFLHIIDRAFALRIDARFASARAMADALAHCGGASRGINLNFQAPRLPGGDNRRVAVLGLLGLAGLFFLVILYAAITPAGS